MIPIKTGKISVYCELVIIGIMIDNDAMLCVKTTRMIPTTTEETSTPTKAPAAHSIEIIAKLTANDFIVSKNITFEYLLMKI